MGSKFILWLCSLMVCAQLFYAPANATERASRAQSEDRAVARMALAIRKRFMVQMIAKGTCFAMTQHKPAENAEQAWHTIDFFDESGRILVAGDPDLNMDPETEPAVLAAMDALDANWGTYRAATRQIVSGDWHTVPMGQILRLNNIVLDQMNAAVDQIVLAHSTGLSTRLSHAATINIAGRQRMLIQNAAREMCFISLLIDERTMRQALAKTVSLFETSLFALENGDFEMSVIDPPSLAILQKLSEIRTLWQAYRAPLDQVIAGDQPSPDQIALVERLNLPLFELTDQLVGLYLN